MSQTPNVPAPAGGPRQQFLATIEKAAHEFASGQPLSVGAQDLKRSIDRVMVAFRQAAAASPDLMQCDPTSIARAIALSALTGLQPGGPLPDVYLLPQRANGRLTCDWRISWRGYATLCARAGYRLRAVEVHEGDTFEYAEGLFPDLKHLPAGGRNTWDTLQAVYVVAHRVGHQHEVPAFMVVPRSTIEARRNASPSRNSGPWQSWPLEMARKAAIRYAIQRGLVPLDDVAAHAYEQDRDTVEAQPAAAVQATPNTYFIGEDTTPSGVAAVVAAAEKLSPSAAVAPQASQPTAALLVEPKKPRSRAKKAPVTEPVTRDQAAADRRAALLADAEATHAELSSAEDAAIRKRIGAMDEHDTWSDEQLVAYYREGSLVVDERGAE